MRTAVLLLAGLLVRSGAVIAAESPALPDIYQRVSPAVVVIRTTEHEAATGTDPWDTAARGTTNLGSGVVVSADGLIMTAAHVIQLADAIAVQFVDGYMVTARVEAASTLADVALIRLDEVPEDLTVAPMGDSEGVRVGEQVFVVGAPYGLGHTLTVGHLSGRRQPRSEPYSITPVEFLQTDAAINEGNSGGPLFDMTGQVIGIVSHIQSRSGGHEGLGFATTINMAREVLLEQESLWTGIEFIVVEGELARALNLPQPMGFLVQRVARRSPGEQLGLRVGTLPATVDGREMLLGGDIILEIAGLPVEGQRDRREQVDARLAALPEGGMLEMKVWREGEVTILATLR